MKTAALPGSVGSSFNRQQPWLACGWTGRIMLVKSCRFALARGPPCLPQHLCRRSDPVLLAAVKCLLRTVPNLDACADLCFTIGHHQSFNHFLYPHSVHPNSNSFRVYSEPDHSKGQDEGAQGNYGNWVGWNKFAETTETRVNWGSSCGIFPFLPNVDFIAHFPLILICPPTRGLLGWSSGFARSSRTQILFLAT